MKVISKEITEKKNIFQTNILLPFVPQILFLRQVDTSGEIPI